jgi:CDP-glucose 4,6-dehydratase
MSFDQILSVKQKLNSPVLIIGHTGFKGTWLTLLLERLGIELTGISLPADTSSLYSKLNRHGQIDEYFQDIREAGALEKLIQRIKPKYVFHLAAQPLVLNSYKTPSETFETNVMGTVNVLNAATKIDNCEHIVVSTTDKVYKNDDSSQRFTENSALGGKDPYSWSKVGTEAAIGAWQQIALVNGGPKISSVRAGNVIGGGDQSENRLLPDLIKSFSSNTEILLRNPQSTRPWQHALDPLWGYVLALTADLNESVFNFSPDGNSLTVLEVAGIALNAWGSNIKIALEPNQSKLESNTLELNSSLAKSKLNWNNRWSQENAVISTVNWWKSIEDKTVSPTEACEINLEELFTKVNNEQR